MWEAGKQGWKACAVRSEFYVSSTWLITTFLQIQCLLSITIPANSGHHCDLKKMSTIECCPLHRGFPQIYFKCLLLQMPAPKCIGTAPPYSPTGVPLLKLIKLMGQRHNGLSLHHIFKKSERKKAKCRLIFLEKTWYIALSNI